MREQEQEPDPDAPLVAAWQNMTLTRDAFEKFTNRLHRWFCSQDRRLREREQVKELVGETVRRVAMKIHAFEGKAKFFTWVIEFAKRVLFEHYEKRKEPPAAMDTLLTEAAADDPEQEVLNEMELDEAKAQVLTDHERRVFTLRWDEDLSFKEIGERVGTTDDAAQQTGMRAFKKVYGFIREQGWRSPAAVSPEARGERERRR